MSGLNKFSNWNDLKRLGKKGQLDNGENVIFLPIGLQTGAFEGYKNYSNVAKEDINDNITPTSPKNTFNGLNVVNINL